MCLRDEMSVMMLSSPFKEVPPGGVYGAVDAADGLLERCRDKRIALSAYLWY